MDDNSSINFRCNRFTWNAIYVNTTIEIKYDFPTFYLLNTVVTIEYYGVTQYLIGKYLQQLKLYLISYILFITYCGNQWKLWHNSIY